MAEAARALIRTERADLAAIPGIAAAASADVTAPGARRVLMAQVVPVVAVNPVATVGEPRGVTM